MLVLANTLAQVMMLLTCIRVFQVNLDRDTDYPAEVCRGSY